jgi:Salmonella virulence plasmid 65kDa B protein
MATTRQRPGRAWIAPLMFLLCVLAQGGCACRETIPQKPPRGLLACRTRSPKSAPVTGDAPEVETVSAGEIQTSFAVASGGLAVVDMPLVAVPGRAGVEPQLSLHYESGGGAGVAGEGVSIGGLSSISRCPSQLTDEPGEIRGVRFDAEDKLCLEGKPLVRVGEAAGVIELRTFPDTQGKVLGHYPPGGGVQATGCASRRPGFSTAGARWGSSAWRQSSPSRRPGWRAQCSWI